MIVKAGDRLGYEDWMELWLVPDRPKYPNIFADPSCPTWARQTWWDRLWRRKPRRVMFMLPGAVFICSHETKAFYDANPQMPIEYRTR